MAQESDFDFSDIVEKAPASGKSEFEFSDIVESPVKKKEPTSPSPLVRKGATSGLEIPGTSASYAPDKVDTPATLKGSQPIQDLPADFNLGDALNKTKSNTPDFAHPKQKAIKKLSDNTIQIVGIESKMAEIQNTIPAIDEQIGQRQQELLQRRAAIETLPEGHPDIAIYNQEIEDIKKQEDERNSIAAQYIADKEEYLNLIKENESLKNITKEGESNLGQDVVGNFWNGLVASTVHGAGRTFKALGQTGILFPGSQNMDAVTNAIGDFVMEMGDSVEFDTSDESKSNLLEGDLTTTKVVGNSAYLLGNLASMIIPGGVASRVLNADMAATKLASAIPSLALGVDGAFQSATEAGLSEKEANLFAIPVGVMMASLDMVGAGEMIEKVSKGFIARQVTKDAIKNLAGKEVTEAAVFRAAGDSFKGILKGISTGTIKGVASEGVTGALQETGTIAAEEITDAVRGVDGFDNSNTLDILKRIGLSAAMEALPGGAFGGFTGSLHTENASLYEKAIEFKKDPEAFALFQKSIEKEIELGHITPEQADGVLKKIEAMGQLDEVVPDNVTEPKARLQAVNLITERNALQEKIKNTDKDLVSESDEQALAETKEKLKKIANGESIEPVAIEPEGQAQGEAAVEQPVASEVATPEGSQIEPVQEPGTEQTSEQATPVNSEVQQNGLMFGLNRDDINQVITSIPKKLKEWFYSSGLMPRTAFKIMVNSNANLNGRLKEMEHTSRKFKSAIKEAYGKDFNEATAKELDDYLKGQNTNPQNIPADVIQVLDEMRNSIDALSREMIKEGVVSDKAAVNIGNNMGVYMTRSYRVHDANKEWRDFIYKTPEGQLLKNRAEAHIRSEYAANGINLTNNELEGIIGEILHKEDAPAGLLTKGAVGSKDISILQKRKDIAPEIRALMGEYSDPLLNYTRSITKMANLVQKHILLSEVKKDGLGKYLFEHATGDSHVQIAAEGSATMSPLNGLYTTKEIADAFKEFEPAPVTEKWLKNYLAVNGFVKYAKTVLSWTTHVRNIVGNLGFIMANSHYDFGKAGVAGKTVWSELGAMDKDAFLKKYQDYVRLGVVYDNPNAAELQEVIKDVTGKKDGIEKLFDSRVNRIKNKTFSAINKLYQIEDDFFKIYAFENELARYKKAYPNMDDAELNAKVAEIIRATYPTYSMVGKAVKYMRRLPVVGTFTAFPAEVIRTFGNTIAIAFRELEVPETRAIGARRMMGVMMATSMTAIGAAISRAMTGVSKEEEEDMRRFMPEWSENSQLIHVGDKTFIDLGGSDPHNFLKKPFIAALRGDNPADAFIDGVATFLKPFTDEQILSKRLLEVRSNKDSNGRPIYNEQLPQGEQWAEIFDYLGEAVEPGIVNQAQRLYKGLKGEVSTQGKQYSAFDEAVALGTGQRIERMNVSQALSFKVYQFRKEIDEAEKIYTSMKYKKGNVSPEEMEQAYKNSNEALTKLYEKIHKDINAAQRLGVKPVEIATILKRNRLTNKKVIQIVTGKAIPVQR